MIAWYLDSKSLRRCLGGAAILVFGCGGAPPSKPRVDREKPTSQVAKDPAPEPTLSQLSEKARIELEKFLQRDDLTPKMRAEAMFRLAALHVDRAEDEGTQHRDAAISLYTQIIRDLPETDVAAPSHLFLGYALHDAERDPEAQHLFRSLVCSNHFSFVPPSPLGAKFAVKPLPQEHDDAYWRAWEAKHRVPLDRLPKKSKITTPDEETTFINPYPADCKSRIAATLPGETLRFVANAWWEIGEFHFNQFHPFSYNLSAVAYQNAIQAGNSTLRTVAMYKLAWTFFKQQRYEASVAQFVELLRQPKEPATKVKDVSLDLQKEACTYIAGSLTFVDFRGPPAEDPFIPRDDVLDTERDPHVVEQKMHIALDRVRDPKIIPQNEPWTSDIHAALIDEFRGLNQWKNLIETAEVFLAKWPNDSRAADIRKAIEQARVHLTAR